MSGTDFRSVVEARHSCRAFLSDPVDEPTIREIVRLARHAPSWCNTQPWFLDILTGGSVARLAKAFADPELPPPRHDFAPPAAYSPRALQRRRDAGFGLYAAVGIAHGDREASAHQAARNFSFFGAPHVAILSVDAEAAVYGAIDCGGFLNCFLLACTAHGVASVAQAALASQPDMLRRLLALPANRRIVAGISFGYADAAQPAAHYRPGRDPIDDFMRLLPDLPARPQE